MKRAPDIWQMAAAVLLQNNMLHSKEITDLILRTGRVKLGGETPERTVASKLAKTELQGRAVFSRCGEGYWCLVDEDFVLTSKGVQHSLEILRDMSESTQLQSLRLEVARLRDVLRAIAEMSEASLEQTAS